MQTLDDPTAAAYVGYALNHQVQPCYGVWPYNITPTVPEVDVFLSGCNLLNSPLFTPSQVAFILSQLPTVAPPPGVKRLSR
jgi:hypothetical protein